MRYFLISVLLFSMSCANEGSSSIPVANNANETEIDHSEDADYETSKLKDSLQSNGLNDGFVFQNQEVFYYAGIIDLYNSQVVMNLVANGNTITGTYYYSKRQKELQLTGQINYSDQSIELEESYKGKTTGYFTGNFSKSGIKGIWQADKDGGNSADFSLSQLAIDPKKSMTGKDRFKRYSWKYESGLYNSETDEYDPYDAKNSINISYIDQTTFDFYYHVDGMNGHSGSIAGLANMTNEIKGIYTDHLGCELTFNFNLDTLEISASDCQDYAGMRAHFGGKLVRE